MRLLLVGPRSSPNLVYGMSLGFDLLVSGLSERGIEYVVIDRSAGASERRIGTFSLIGIYYAVSQLIQYTISLFGTTAVYITIGSSLAGFFRDLIMILLASFFHKRIVLHLKGGGYKVFYNRSNKIIKFLIRETLQLATQIIVLGELLKDQFDFLPSPLEKIVVVPNGLPDGIGVVKRPSKNSVSTECFKLLYLSNMIPSKGYLDVLYACSFLYRKGIPVSCDFCGSFIDIVHEESSVNNEVEFRQAISSLGLNGVVKYHGVVRAEKKTEFLLNADLFLLPTYYQWEGQPISIIEALAFGLPVVSTNFRGIPELLIEAYNGFFVNPKSPEEIANVIEKLWLQPGLYHRLSRNAFIHYRDNFTREAHLERLIPVLTG